jgi:hypothetical protein
MIGGGFLEGSKRFGWRLGSATRCKTRDLDDFRFPRTVSESNTAVDAVEIIAAVQQEFLACLVWHALLSTTTSSSCQKLLQSASQEMLVYNSNMSAQQIALAYIQYLPLDKPSQV